MRTIVASGLGVMLAGMVPLTAVASTPEAESIVPQNVLYVSLVRDGTPVSGDVVVQAWPSPAVDMSLQPEDTVPVHPIGGYATGSDGKAEILLDPTLSANPAIADQDGLVSLEISVADAATQASWNITLKNHGGTKWLPANYIPGQEKVLLLATTITFDLATGVVTDPSVPRDQMVDFDGTELTDAEARAATTTRTEARGADFEDRLGSARDGKYGTCAWINKGYLYGLNERFVTVSAWSGAHATLVQGSGTTHTLGVAIKDWAGWSASGTQTISSGASRSLPGFTTVAAAYNKVNYRVRNLSCPGVRVRTYHLPVGLHSLITSTAIIARKAYTTGCITSPYTSGTWTKNSAKNMTYAGGVSLGPFSVSAQSGWNSDTSISWLATAPTRVCGSTSSGWVSSPLIDVRKW